MSRLQKTRIKFSFILKFLLAVSLTTLPTISMAALPLVPNCQGTGCTYCDFLQLIKNVIDFLMEVVFPIVLAMIVYGGFMIMIAGPSPERAKKGRDIIKAAIIGLLIALLAWLVLDTIIQVVAKGWSRLQIGPWNQLDCRQQY